MRGKGSSFPGKELNNIGSEWNSSELKGMTWKFIAEEHRFKFISLPLIKNYFSNCSKEEPSTLCIESK